MTRKVKLLILSVSAGAGHVRAAQALAKTAEEQYPDVEAIHLDVMDYVPKLFRKLYAESYIQIVNHQPALWGYMYQKSDLVRNDKSAIKKLRVAIEEINTAKLKKLVKAMAPDTIISTHFLPPELISKLIRKGYQVPPSWVQVTDFDLHGLWVHEHMSGYFAASEEVAFRMEQRGIPKETISVTGIPIMPVFGQPLSRKECAGELGLDPAVPTIIVMSGGLGVGGISSLTEQLLNMEENFQIIALAGKNEKLLKELQKLANKTSKKLVPMGFTKTIERPMKASDLAVTKPGGLTTSECLAMGLPMIAVSPIPGQEERNADYLLESGAGLKAHDAIGVEFKVRQLLKNPKTLQQMSRNALGLGRPKAAEKVLQQVLKGFV